MYQFTTTNVINSAYALDYDGNILLDGTGSQIAKYVGSATAFNVAKVGSFKKANIVSVYKRGYSAGVLEVGTITIVTGTAGDVLRLSVDIKLTGSANSEYVNYSMDFKKPVVVEILSSGVASTDAAAFALQLNSLKNRFGYAYFKTSANGAILTLTANDAHQKFNSIIESKAVDNDNSITMVDYPTIATGAITTAGRIGFGDDAWMLKSIMVPTAENVRYFGTSRDERPIMGGNYTEFVLRYSLDKDGQDGIVSGAKSVTTHVFYVKSDLVAGFEAAVETTLGAQVLGGIALTAAGNATTLVNLLTLQLTTTGAVGAVTYTSSAPTVATVSATGLITAAASPALGNVTFTATDTFGNTATIVIEVVAA